MLGPPPDCAGNRAGHTSINVQNKARTHTARPRAWTWHFNKRLIVGNQSNYSMKCERKQFGNEVDAMTNDEARTALRSPPIKTAAISSLRLNTPKPLIDPRVHRVQRI